MVQGINREDIFNTSKNKDYYLKYIDEVNKQNNIIIISYCIMTNHAHFLIKSDKIAELSDFMKKINTKYAIYYNRINNRVGYVFRDRFKLQEINSIEHFYRCVEYIHDNPIKAGLCNGQDEYKYSSFNAVYNSNRIQLYASLKDIIEESLLRAEQEQQMDFLEVEEYYKGKEDSIIEELLRKNNITKYQLLSNENFEKLKNIIMILKDEYKISYRKMEKSLGISREKLRMINRK